MSNEGWCVQGFENGWGTIMNHPGPDAKPNNYGTKAEAESFMRVLKLLAPEYEYRVHEVLP